MLKVINIKTSDAIDNIFSMMSFRKTHSIYEETLGNMYTEERVNKELYQLRSIQELCN